MNGSFPFVGDGIVYNVEVVFGVASGHKPVLHWFDKEVLGKGALSARAVEIYIFVYNYRRSVDV